MNEWLLGAPWIIWVVIGLQVFTLLAVVLVMSVVGNVIGVMRDISYGVDSLRTFSTLEQYAPQQGSVRADAAYSSQAGAGANNAH